MQCRNAHARFSSSATWHCVHYLQTWSITVCARNVIDLEMMLISGISNIMCRSLQPSCLFPSNSCLFPVSPSPHIALTPPPLLWSLAVCRCLRHHALTFYAHQLWASRADNALINLNITMTTIGTWFLSTSCTCLRHTIQFMSIHTMCVYRLPPACNHSTTHIVPKMR